VTPGARRSIVAFRWPPITARKWQEPDINAPTAAILTPALDARVRSALSKTTLVWAAMILAVGLFGTSVAANPYLGQIGLFVAESNATVHTWNFFAEEFNTAADSAQKPNHELARGSLRRTSQLGNAAQALIAEWNAIQPPERYLESHALAGQAMRATQSAFHEISPYLEQVVHFGITFPDRAGRATPRLEEASRLPELARAAAIAGR